MRDASAYAALGLEPDADDASIERAYKRLIKLHHPDREGGDSVRAAEINRAYRELRSDSPAQDLVLAHDEPAAPRGTGWVRAAVLLLFAVAVPFLLREFMPTPQAPLSAVAPTSAAGPIAPDAMDQPLHIASIRGAIRQAAASVHNQGALLAASRDCSRIFRQQPSLAQLDRCAALDDAVVQLQNNDALWDQGPFSQLSVTSRQWSAASSLSNDYLAIDSRLDRIRVQVELALAPPVLPPPRPEVEINSD